MAPLLAFLALFWRGKPLFPKKPVFQVGKHLVNDANVLFSKTNFFVGNCNQQFPGDYYFNCLWLAGNVHGVFFHCYVGLPECKKVISGNPKPSLKSQTCEPSAARKELRKWLPRSGSFVANLCGELYKMDQNWPRITSESPVISVGALPTQKKRWKPIYFHRGPMSLHW